MNAPRTILLFVLGLGLAFLLYWLYQNQKKVKAASVATARLNNSYVPVGADNTLAAVAAAEGGTIIS